MPRIHSFREAGERYPVLRFAASGCTWLGFLLLSLGALLILVGVAALMTDLPRPYHGAGTAGIAITWSIGLLFSGFQSLAMGSFFRLAIHVEENTRATAQALDKLREGLGQKPEVDARSIFLS